MRSKKAWPLFILLALFFLPHTSWGKWFDFFRFEQHFFLSPETLCAISRPQPGEDYSDQTGLFPNDEALPAGVRELPETFNFDGCGGGLDACYPDFFSTDNRLPDPLPSSGAIAGAGVQQGSRNAEIQNLERTETLFTYRDLTGTPHYQRRPHSGEHYARLIVLGPNTSTKMSFSTLATGSTLRFWIQRAYVVTEPNDRSTAVNGVVRVRRGGRSAEYSLAGSCPIVGEYLHNGQPRADIHPSGTRLVSRVCPYEEMEVDIPVGSDPVVTIEWEIIAGPAFHYSYTGNQCRRLRDGQAIACPPFSPYAIFSIDDMTMEPTEAPALACERYEIEKDENMKCWLGRETAPQRGFELQLSSGLPYHYRIRPHEWGEATVVRRTSLRHRPPATGLYTVDALCTGDLHGRTYSCGRSEEEAHIWVRDSGGTAPDAARVAATQAVIFPPKEKGCYTQGVTRYQIYRRETPEAPPQQIGEMEAQAMIEQGFVDERVPVNANPHYAVRPFYGEEEGARSGWALTSWQPGRLTLMLDHFPLPGFPAHFETHYQVPSNRSIAVAIAPLPIRILRGASSQERLNALGFRSDAGLFFAGDEIAYTPTVTLGGMLNQYNPPTGTMTLIPPNEDDQALTELNDYTGLPETHTLWVVAGDLTRANFTRAQVLKALSYVQGEQPVIDLSQCDFEGNRFRCEAPMPVPFMGLEIPTPHQSLGQALTYLYYNPNGGLLRSRVWRGWADQRQSSFSGQIYSNAQNMTDLSFLDPSNAAVSQSFALGLATYEAAGLVTYDRQPGNNLFHLGSSLLTDWFPALDVLILHRLLVPFVEQILNGGGAEWGMLSQGLIRLMDGVQEFSLVHHRSSSSEPFVWEEVQWKFGESP